jgi:uncharacterized protein YfaS (alpha-2-macroglobulin family)
VSSRQFFRRGGFASIVISLGLLAGLIAYGVTEEIALGSLSGRALMVENGLPISNATVIISPYADSEDAPSPRVVLTDDDGNFRLSSLPVGEYIVESSARAHALSPMVIRVKEGGPTLVDLELQPHEPRLSLRYSNTVFTPGEAPEFMLDGFTPEPRAYFTVYKLNVDAIVKEGGFQELLWSLAYGTSDTNLSPSKMGTKVVESEHTIANRELEGTFQDAVKLPTLEEGFYYIEASMGELKDRIALNVSSVGLITKASPAETLCFVADLKTGKPIAGAQISALKDKALLPLGQTGADGTFSFKPVANEQSMVVGTVGGSTAIVSYYQPDAVENGQNERIFAYTDRPVYRPGDKIQFKGFVRREQGGTYALPAPGPVELEFRDDSGTLIDRQTLQMRANGAFSGELSTNIEAAPGVYSVLLSSPSGQQTMPVQVAAYRKPEYSVDVTWDKPFYPMGSKARAIVKCEYYFGGPVVGAKVTAYVNRNPSWGGYDEEYAEEYGYEEEYYGGGEYIEEVEATTNDKGEAVIEFDTKIEGDPGVPQSDYLYTLEASVVDAGDKYFDGRGSVRVTRGAFDLSLRTDRYVVSGGAPIKATVSALEHETKKPVANQPIRVVAGFETWTRRESVFTPLSTFNVTTDAEGKAEIEIKAPTDKSLVIRAIAEDSGRRRIQDEAWVWVEGGSLRGGGEAISFDLTLDKPSYRGGETAKALIATNKVGGSALVTVESTRIHWSKVVALDGQTTAVEIPVSSAFLPQATVSVVGMNDKKYLQTQERLKLDLAPQKLKVTVAADKAEYMPGNKATYSVSTTDENGKGVSADVSLAVVDESIYAIQEDQTDPVATFYSNPGNRVTTAYSFPELYLDGGDKAGAISLRTDFRDTAAWVPNVRTGPDGKATVTVDLPDNLTTWRATVVALSDDTDVGMGTGEVVVSKPLMVRLQGPRVMTQQDQQEISAVVTNDSGSDQRVRVSLEAQGFGVEGAREQVVSVRDGQTVPVRWTVTANGTGESVLAARAFVENGPNDGVEQKIQVLPHGRESNFRTSGIVRGTDKVFVARRPDADPNTGRLKVTLTPTIAASLFESLDELVGFPYGCTEQTMSRFLPSILVSNLLKQNNVSAPELSKPIPEIVADGLSRLAKMQHYDGGWGWWENDDSDPWMTAYVLHGLKIASDAGYDVSPFMKERGVAWMKQRAMGEVPLSTSGFNKGYMAYVLALYDQNVASERIARQVDTKLDGFHSQAFIALAYHQMGMQPEAGRALTEVKQAATTTGGVASWPVKDNYMWDVEPTAISLLAIQQVEPTSDLVQKAIRYLMVQRQGDGWFSTRSTSFSLIAISSYLARTGEAMSPSTVTVTLNGAPVQSVRLDPRNWKSVQPTITVPLSDLKSGQNVLEFTVAGSPVAYYALDLKQIAVAERLGELLSGDGFRIDREYFVLKPQKMEDGTLRLTASRNPVTRAQAGDLIRCVIKVTSDKPRQFVMLEDFTPSNCRVTEREMPGENESWDWWWSRTVVKDDRVALFARELPTGVSEFTYTMRAETPGVSIALPPVAGNMYDPTERASDSETRFEVRR